MMIYDSRERLVLLPCAKLILSMDKTLIQVLNHMYLTWSSFITCTCFSNNNSPHSVLGTRWCLFTWIAIKYLSQHTWLKNALVALTLLLRKRCSYKGPASLSICWYVRLDSWCGRPYTDVPRHNVFRHFATSCFSRVSIARLRDQTTTSDACTNTSW